MITINSISVNLILTGIIYFYGVFSTNLTDLTVVPPIYTNCIRNGCNIFSCFTYNYTCPCKCGYHRLTKYNCQRLNHRDTTMVLIGISLPYKIASPNTTEEIKYFWKIYRHFFNSIVGGPFGWITYQSDSVFIQGMR